MDLIFCFWVGHNMPDGRIEMRIRRIARAYLRGWFILDVIVVGSDVANEFLDLVAGMELLRVGKMARVLRVARCVRMVRMMRMVKLIHVVEQICDYAFSGPLLTVLNICKLLFGLAILVHFMACAWYSVGMECMSRGEMSWLTPLVEAGASKLYLYAIAYHWTIAQFTPAPNNYHPMNVYERVYSISVLFIGLIIFSSLLGSTTASLNMSRKEAYTKLVETGKVRRYLSENRVSLRLSNQIHSNLRTNRSKNSRVMESDIMSLKALPNSLQVELRYEVHSQSLSSPVFEWLKESFHAAVVEVCSTAVSEVIYNKGDEPFSYRTPGASVHYIISGQMVYHPGRSTLFGAAEQLGTGGCSADSKPISCGACLSEAVLWQMWEHQGLLTAAGTTAAMKVNADGFRIALQRHRAAARHLRRYVHIFVARMQAMLDKGDPIDDTHRAFTDLPELEEALEMSSSEGQDVAGRLHTIATRSTGFGRQVSPWRRPWRASSEPSRRISEGERLRGVPRGVSPS